MKSTERVLVRAGAWSGLLAVLPFLFALIGWTAHAHDLTRPMLAVGSAPLPELRSTPPTPGGGSGVILDALPPERPVVPRAAFTPVASHPHGATVHVRATLAELGRRQTDGG